MFSALKIYGCIFFRLELFYRASVDVFFNYYGNFDGNIKELVNMGPFLWNLMVQIRNEQLINMMDKLDWEAQIFRGCQKKNLPFC